MNDATISVHIVAWNSMAYLASLLKSLEEQKNGSFRISVVDNASTDGATAWLMAEWPHIGVLRNMRNYGFARAHNQAVQLALSGWQDADLSHRYVVLCNPDMELEESCLERLHGFLEAHPEMDAATPKLLRAHLRLDAGDQMETERTNVIDAAGLVITKARRAYDRGAGEQDSGQYNEPCEIFGASGACVMLRASSILRASIDGQLFDEDFFAYQEDVDLAWRMRRLGMHTAYVPTAVAWHHRRIQSQPAAGWLGTFLARWRKPSFVNFLSTRNHCWLLVKHLSWSELFLHSPWIVTYEVGKLFVAPTSWASIKGYVAAMAGLPRAFKQRARLAALNRVPPRELRTWFV